MLIKYHVLTVTKEYSEGGVRFVPPQVMHVETYESDGLSHEEVEKVIVKYGGDGADLKEIFKLK